jgi:hypothetical protein
MREFDIPARDLSSLPRSERAIREFFWSIASGIIILLFEKAVKWIVERLTPGFWREGRGVIMSGMET